MQLRNLYVKCSSCTILCKKDKTTYRSTYSVILMMRSGNPKKFTAHNRDEAKSEIQRLLRLYTNLSETEILKIK